MMGLQNSGQGTWEEFAKTMSFPTYAEKNANAMATIESRLREMGVKGLINLVRQKIDVFYSCPDLQPGGIIPYDTNEFAEKIGFMTTRNYYYLIYNCIFFYGVVFLAFASIFVRTRNFTAYLAVLGLHLFFVMWEVNARWITNYVPVLIFLACLTVKALIDEYINYKSGGKNICRL